MITKLLVQLFLCVSYLRHQQHQGALLLENAIITHAILQNTESVIIAFLAVILSTKMFYLLELKHRLKVISITKLKLPLL